jgi:accessory Sec system glycosylation protein GtfA
MGHGNSGVEHAQFYRAARFREKKLPFKLIFTDFLPQLHEHMQEWHLAENEVIGLYDYLLSQNPDAYLEHGNLQVNQSSEEVLWDLTNTQRIIQRTTTGEYRATIQRVKRYSEKKQIQLVEDDRVILRNNTHQIMWHYRDDPTEAGEGRVMTSIHLDNFKGKNYYFKTFEALVTFFLAELNQYYPKSTYFIDRGTENEEALVLMKLQGAPIKLVDIVHASHLSTFQNGHPLWNNYYQYMFDHLEDMDAIVNATTLQTTTMRQNIREAGLTAQPAIVTIPVGGVETVAPARHWQGDELKFVTASRLHPEKHISHIIKAIDQLRQAGHNATLMIYGSGGDRPALEKLVTELSLTESVTFGGLSQHVVTDLKQFDAFVSASYSEGFGLTYVEAISDALPIASYANLFGAKELVRENVNGHLATFERQDDAETENIKSLARAMSMVFQSPAHYAQLSEGATRVAVSFSAGIIADKWADLVRKVNHEN